MKYAVFLRGINVGNIKVPMAELRVLLAALPVSKAKTFLQTGNISLESEMAAEELATLLAQALSRRFQYEAFVLVFPHETLASIIARFPFVEQADKHRYVIFCDRQVTAEELANSRNALDRAIEDVAVGDRVVYWQVPVGSTLNTAFANILGKPKYKATTTNRNIKTLQRMVP